MVQVEDDVREKVKGLLKELFQFENQDLDFGIYRIMNFKRKEIERFIEEDLITAAEEQFREYAKVGMANLQKEVERLRAEIVRDFGDDTIDEQGSVRKNNDAPKIKEYSSRIKELKEAELAQSQIADVFNHVYEFFSRYYHEGDFIPKRRFGGNEKYYVPYNGEEVALHWATKDMYYVKTGEFFKKYSFRNGRFLVTFVLVEAKVELGNTKGEKKYFILSDEQPASIDEAASTGEIKFNYRNLSDEERSKYGKRDVQEILVAETLNKIRPLLESSSISSVLRPRPGEEKPLLEKHLNAYVDRNTKDYFIHKNLKEFLERELDFYLKNEVLNLDELETSNEAGAKLIMAKAKTIHGISSKIIEFLNQIESFQKSLFEKKKFVLRTDYCITLDLVPLEFYEEIGKNEKQVSEWKDLYQLDEITKGSFYDTANKRTLPVDFLKQYKYLGLDTKNFTPDFKDRLLGKIANLDDITNGLMIKGDNYQALRLLENRYGEKIKCIYIDPPYNIGGDGFLYKDNYQHSSWLTMMKTCLEQSIALMHPDGVIFTSIDDTEQSRLKGLEDLVYGQNNFVSNIIWQKKFSPQNDALWFSDNHDFVICYSKNKAKWRPNQLPRTEEQNERYKNPDNDQRGLWMSGGLDAKTYSAAYDYPIKTPSGRIVNPPAGYCWRLSPERFEEMVEDNRIWFGEKGDNVPRIKRFLSEVKEGITPLTVWTYEEVGHNQEGKQELKAMISEGEIFDTPKVKRLLKRIITIGANRDSYIMDFFAGSGTTAEATMELNREDAGTRKYILIEVGDYFESTMKKRIQKAIFTNEWKDGIPQSLNGMKHCFKYQYLENYEDTLNNIILKESDKSVQETLDTFGDYFLRYMLDYETRDSPTRLLTDKFQTPFDYKIKTIGGNEEKEVTVDLVETFNYLLGLNVEHLQVLHDGDRIYRVVFGRKETERFVIVWRNTGNIDLERDKKFVEGKILSGNTYDVIFINGDSYVKSAQPIEPEFKRLMGA